MRLIDFWNLTIKVIRMANFRDIIVFDFETGGANPYTCQPTQIAAVAIHARKLELQPGGVFNSEMRPIIDDEKAIEAGVAPLEDKALEITRKTRSELAKAPMPKTGLEKFSKFCEQYNWKKHRIMLRLLLDTTSTDMICQLSKECVSSTGQLTRKKVARKSLTQFLLLMLCSTYIAGLKTIRTLRAIAWITCETILAWVAKAKKMLTTLYRTLKIRQT